MTTNENNTQVYDALSPNEIRERIMCNDVDGEILNSINPHLVDEILFCCDRNNRSFILGILGEDKCNEVLKNIYRDKNPTITRLKDIYNVSAGTCVDLACYVALYYVYI